jgi:hypothetical protein
MPKSLPTLAQTVAHSLARCALATLSLAMVAPAQAEKVGAYHIMPTPEYQARMGRVPPPLPAGGMQYFGGSVLANVKLVSVIWGSKVNPTTVAGIPGFSAAMVNSTYVDQMAEYSTNFKHGTHQTIQRGSFLGQTQITPQNTSLSLTNDDVVKELKYQTKGGFLPPHDLNTLYMIYFPANITITLDGIQSCRDFGAYHYASVDTKMKKSNIFYSVEPDCGFNFNTITFIAGHEFAEAMTDNIPTPGSNPAFPQAWNTVDGYEIGDLCGGSGQLVAGAKSYSVSQYYLNTTGQCSTSNYTSP